MISWHKSKEDPVKQGVRENYTRIWRYALSMTGSRDQADDLAQAACLRAIERRHQFEVGTDVGRWLFRITHNLWISEIRRDKVRRGNGLIGIETVDIVDPSQDGHARLQHTELLEAVLHLPEAQRQTVALVYVEGFSYKDAAHILGIPRGTVMSRLAAARGTLTKKLRDVQGDRHAN